MSVVFIIHKNYNNECKSYKDNFIIIRNKNYFAFYLSNSQGERETERRGGKGGIMIMTVMKIST